MDVDTRKIDPSLLFLELPAFSNNIDGQRVNEVYIKEGDAVDQKTIDSCSYFDSGGGHHISGNSAIKRTLHWRTHAGVLELFEYSMNTSLQHNHFRLVFQNSKVVPGVKIFSCNGQVFVLFATLHAVHRLCFTIPHPKHKDQSVLRGLTASQVEDENHCRYFNDVEQVTSFSAGLVGPTGSRQQNGAVFVVGPAVGAITLIKMPVQGQSIVYQLNKTSRMSRIFSGINPWAGGGSVETPCGLELVCLNSSNPKVVAICKDNKIRVWSCVSLDCVAQFDLEPFVRDETSQQNANSEQRIRILQDETTGNWMICVYFASANNAVFVNFKTNINVTNFEHVSTIKNIADVISTRLIAFQLTASNHLWALWLDTDEQMALSVCDLNTSSWHEVALSAGPSPEVVIPGHITVKEAYMHELFSSKKFSLTAIQKAMAIHQKSALSVRGLTEQTLRESVVRNMEEEVAMLLPVDSEPFAMDSTELIEIQLNVWQKFYGTCVQYQQYVSEPVGLTEGNGGMINVIKKEHVSFLVPVSCLEAVCRGADPNVFKKIFPDETYFDDLAALLQCITLLSSILGEDFVESLVQALGVFPNPIDAVADSLLDVKELVSENFDFEAKVDEIGDVMSAVQMLLNCLEPEMLNQDLQADADLVMGDQGLEVLAKSVRRYINDRLHLSLLLLIFTSLKDELESALPSRVSTYVQAYNALWWAVTEKCERVSQATLENSLQSLSMHDIPLPTASSRDVIQGGLLEYYLQSEGGRLVEYMLRTTCPEFTGVIDQSIVPQATGIIVQLLWPLGPTLSFPEFLLAKGQFSRLHRYIERDLNSWTNFCLSYVTHMLAHCHLHFGRYDKAVRCFIQAGVRASSEPLLLSRVLQVEDKERYSDDEIEVLYYTKVLHIFESLNLNEQAIVLAKHAIGKACGNDANLPKLCSSIFRHSLELQRHDEAYSAVVRNPDSNHRKDCLRAMVVSLCDRRQYKILVEYSYDDMLDDLVNILEYRARCSDLMTSTHKYYDILFSFHVHRRNYRRAASTMYEQAWRLGVEQSSTNSLQSLQRQHACLVATVTCLQLVDKENQWIVHPITVQEKKQEAVKSPKRNAAGDEVASKGKSTRRKVVIKELCELQRETLLAEMKINIANDCKDETAVGPAMTAEETLALLSHCGLYDDAFLVCSKFKLSKIPIFESLATRCVKASYATDDQRALTWLGKNSKPTSLDHGHSCVADMAWRLLRDYLRQHSVAEMSRCHRAVLNVLLGYGMVVPAWLVTDYKKLNCPEMLRLLICYDYLEEATSLSGEYIDAAWGFGSEHFNIKNSLSVPLSQSWLPLNEIEQLLEILKEMRMQEKYDELHNFLSDKLENYFAAAHRYHEQRTHYRSIA